MRKQGTQLPNRTSLISLTQSHNDHIKKTKDIKSHCDASSLGIHSRKKDSISDHILIKFIPEKSKDKGNNSEDVLRVNKSYRLDFTPAPKRKYSEQMRQKVRISKALQIVSPAVDRYIQNDEEAHEAFKDRVSKYHQEGSKIGYKFKKSMLEVRKRKKQRDEYYTNRSNIVREEARAQLQSIIQKSIQMRRLEGANQAAEGGNFPPLNSKTPRKSLADSLIHPSNLVARQLNADEIRVKNEVFKEHFLARHKQHINRQIQACILQNVHVYNGREKVHSSNRQMYEGYSISLHKLSKGSEISHND